MNWLLENKFLTKTNDPTSRAEGDVHVNNAKSLLLPRTPLAAKVLRAEELDGEVVKTGSITLPDRGRNQQHGNRARHFNALARRHAGN